MDRTCGNDLPAQLHARREASWRMERRDCGCPTGPHADPLSCRCTQPPLSERMVDGYRDAVLHLRGLGLLPTPFIPEMRALWQRGEHQLVSELAEQWRWAG